MLRSQEDWLPPPASATTSASSSFPRRCSCTAVIASTAKSKPAAPSPPVRRGRREKVDQCHHRASPNRTPAVMREVGRCESRSGTIGTPHAPRNRSSPCSVSDRRRHLHGHSAAPALGHVLYLQAAHARFAPRRSLLLLAVAYPVSSGVRDIPWRRAVHGLQSPCRGAGARPAPLSRRVRLPI